MKYWRTFKPSLKFAVIGVSIIEPSGFAIKPLMPASCLICAAEPLAPESAIMKIELKDGCSISFPSESFLISFPSLFIIALATWSFVFDQISTTLLYLSPLVTSPAWYCVSISFTSDSASLRILFFESGIIMSSKQKDTPDLVAYS